MTYAFIEDAQIKFAKEGDHILRAQRIIWEINNNRAHNIQALIEMANAGASKEAVSEIIERWKIKDKDCEMFARVVKVKLDYEVGVWFAMLLVGKELLVGSAITPFDALVDLYHKRNHFTRTETTEAGIIKSIN